MSRLATRLAPRSAADDVLQDALAAAWRRRSSFDAGRGSLRSWLLAIVADHAIKSRRSEARAPAQRLADDDCAASDDGHVDLDLERAIRQLSPRQRIAVSLFYFLDLPITEVAAVMGCAEGTVKSTLADARAHLRRTLDGDGA